MAQPGSSGTASRRHARSEHDSVSIASSRYDADFESKEALQQRELEEARARAAQMEKTMRWWSDCTANWREKWSKVRNERNKAREENKILRTKLEAAQEETNAFRRGQAELEQEKERLLKEVERLRQALVHMRSRDAGGSTRTSGGSSRHHGTRGRRSNTGEADAAEEYVLPRMASEEGSEGGGEAKCTDVMRGEVAPPGMEGGGDVFAEGPLSPTKRTHERSSKSHSRSSHRVESSRRKKISALASREDSGEHGKISADGQHAGKTHPEEDLWSGGATRNAKGNERLDSDNVGGSVNLSVEYVDEQRLAELRAELERLQVENASEWGRRERLESDKQALERENRRLRAELRDLLERMERMDSGLGSVDTKSGEKERSKDGSRSTRHGTSVGSPPFSTGSSTSSSSSTSSAAATAAAQAEMIKQLQQEIADKTKELEELKIAHSKLKAVVRERSTEAAHGARRAEQYEAEVKRLRVRVDELRKELAAAEEEVDAATNNIRKLKRSNEDLQEQMENMQVQIEHLQSRDQGCDCAMYPHSCCQSVIDHRDEAESAEITVPEDNERDEDLLAAGLVNRGNKNSIHF
ncbi:coiled-coil domain-containing protein 102A [Ischnura elegans]|uniref:coiled-coil domain-containing protein 102A n=1 Tax=Ischnura elegans TaxID=197161 RepID=UPI001ED8AD24|nr:coiled-coil domain-containing protein 102A [Ischnura elegans]